MDDSASDNSLGWPNGDDARRLCRRITFICTAPPEVRSVTLTSRVAVAIVVLDEGDFKTDAKKERHRPILPAFTSQAGVKIRVRFWDTGPRSILELVPAEELDRVLHAHHPEIAAAARDAVVNGVAE